MKTSDIFVENLVNKKLLLAAFYHLTYQFGKCKKGQVFNSLTPIVPKWDALPEFRFKNKNVSLEKIPMSAASMSR